MNRLLFALFCLFSVHSPARADEIVLSNGDRLSGHVVHKSKDILTLATDYAGEVKIQWRNVVSLKTEKPVDVLLVHGDDLEHTRLGIGNKNRQVELEHTNRVADLEEIAYINPLPEESGKGVSYRGRANVSAADTSGNSTSRRLYGEAEYTARAKKYRYTLGGKANRSRDFGVQTSSNWLLTGNYDWFLDKRLFRYLRSSLEHDRFKDIDRRVTIGGGYGLQLVENDRTNASVRGGLDYVRVNRRALPNEEYPALGWGFRVSHHLNTANIELFHEHDGYWNLDDTYQITLRSRTGLRVPIAKKLNASAQINVDWERQPAPGRKPTDSTLLFGMGYEW